MPHRSPLTNMIPSELIKGSASRPEHQSLKSQDQPSVPATSKDENKSQPKEQKPISEEPKRIRATSPAPPVRPIPEGLPKVIPKMRKPPKHEYQSKSAVEHSQLSVPVLKTGRNKPNASAAVTRAGVDAVQSALKLSEANQTTRPGVPICKPIYDVRNLHTRLRDNYKGKSTFEMTFQSRGRDEDATHSSETMKSMDSGIFSLPWDDDVVNEWRPEWEKNKVGSAPGEIRGITGMCFTDDHRLAIAEEKNARIQIFDRERGESYTIVQDPFPVRRMNIGGICQLPNRNFLAAADRQHVIYFEPVANGVCRWKAFDKQLHLQGIAVNWREHLFLTDLAKKRVYSYDISGKRLLTFKAEDFLRPEYVAVSEEYSMVFVSDSEQGCVYMFNMNGELLNKIGRQGNEQEKLVYPLGVCCQPNGKLIVCDRGQHRIASYDFRTQCYEHLLTQNDLLYSPTCIATDGDKYLAVAEENHDFKVDEYKLKMFYKCGR